MCHRVYCSPKHLAVRVQMRATEMWRPVPLQRVGKLWPMILWKTERSYAICAHLQRPDRCTCFIIQDSLVGSFACFAQGCLKQGLIFFSFAKHWLCCQCCYCCAVLTLSLFSLCMYLLLPVQCTNFFARKSRSSSPLLIQNPLKAAILKLAQQKTCIL